MKSTAVFLDTGLSAIMGGIHQTRVGREEIGAQLVAACVQQDGCWDVRFLRPNTTNVDLIAEEVRSGPHDALVLFPYTYTKKLADNVARKFKGNVPIIYGGYHAGVGAMSKRVLEEGLADYVVSGRGEEALPRLLRDLAADERPIKAVYRHTQRGELVSLDGNTYPLDGLPWPMRDERLMQNLDVEPLPFLPPPNLVQNPKRCIIIAGSLGCDARCDFCTSWMVAPKSMHRSPKAVVDEMEWLNKTYGSSGAVFHIVNPLFNANREWVMSLCWEMERRGPFPTVCMPDFCLDLEMVQAMKRAGVFMCMMGLEFASTDVRTDRGKRVGNPRIAYELCHEVGIIARAFFMLGRLRMSRADLEAEVQALNGLPFRTDQLRINFEVPFPGSVTASRCSPADVVADELAMTTEHVVYRTSLSEEEWQEARRTITLNYHFSDQQERHYEKKIKKHPELEFPIRDFLDRLKRGNH